MKNIHVKLLAVIFKKKIIWNRINNLVFIFIDLKNQIVKLSVWII